MTSPPAPARPPSRPPPRLPSRRPLRAAIAALALCQATGAAASDAVIPLAQLVHDTWGTREGLPSAFGTDLRVSSQGFVWVGTPDGLARFDGVQFRTFRNGDTPGLPGNYVVMLSEDAEGRLLVATSVGVARLESGDFRQLTAAGLPQPLVALAIAGTPDGATWIGSAEGLLRLEGGRAKALGVAQGLPSATITGLLPGAGGRLWIGTEGGLAVARGDELVNLAGLVSASVSALASGPQGEVWVGTRHGLLRGDEHAFAPVAGLADQRITALLLDAAGLLWAGTEGGLYRLRRDGTGREFLPVTSGVRAIAQDREGGLWLTTYSDGLHRLSAGAFVTYGEPEGIPDGEVSSVLPRPDGSVLLGTLHGLFQIEAGRVLPAPGAPDLAVGATITLRDGSLCFSTAQGRIYRMQAGQPARLLATEDLDRRAHAIVEAPDGSLWITWGTAFRRWRAGRLEPVPTAPELATAWVFDLAYDASGTLWVGTTAGLGRIEDGRLVLVARDEGLWALINVVRPLPSGLYVGTDGGLARLEGDRLRRFTPRDGVPEMSLAGIQDDQRGRLWLFGSRAVASVPLADLEARDGQRVARSSIFGTAHGLRSVEASGQNLSNTARSADGRLWFATMRGASVVDPAALRTNPVPPPILLERVVADGHAYPTGQAVELPAGTRHLEIGYLGLGLRAGNAVRYRHRLVGLDEAFVDAGNERVAHYGNLPPGRYQFQLMAANEDGVWSQGATLVEVEQAPYFWQTILFKVLGALAAAALVWGVTWFRTRSLRAREVVLAARVEAALEKIKVLRGLLPICAWCKKIRDDAGYWQQMEAFVSKHSEAEFTHSMCPECFKKYDDDPDVEVPPGPGAARP